MHLVSMISISILIGIQAIGLLVLSRYILSSPSWTTTLDAFAVARIGASLPGRLPNIASVDVETFQDLNNISEMVSEKLNKNHIEDDVEGKTTGHLALSGTLRSVEIRSIRTWTALQRQRER
jgi:hypothetical protein